MLQGWQRLAGRWATEATHPGLPGAVVIGQSTFEWLEGGAFLIMRSQIDEPGVPSGIAIFGTDDTTGECSMLYFDERGVSRRYEASLRDGELRWWRDTPEFSQRFTGTFSADGDTITGQGELSRDGATWAPDLAITYRRIG